MSDRKFLGVDIGGTKVLAVLVDANGQPVAEHLEPTRIQGGAALADQIAAIRDRLGAQVSAVGVGLPASVDPQSHTLTLIPNIADMEGSNFYRLLVERFGESVLLENDVNTAAIAESKCGEKADPLAFVAIGTGIGMGLVVNGRLLQGRGGAAGEIAQLPLGGEPHETNADTGPLENRLGGIGWRSAYYAAGGAADADLAALFAKPDAAFLRVIEQQADLIARALLAISAVAAPEVFVFGGSIGGQPRVIDAVERRLPDYFTTPPKLRASIWGNRAGAIGAALAAADRFSE